MLYLVRYRDVTNKVNVNIRVEGDCPYEAHRKASFKMRKRKTRSYYWIDTIPYDWVSDQLN